VVELNFLKMKIIIPGVEEIIEINKILGGNVINKSNLEFLSSKILSKYKDKDQKKQIAKIAAIFWMDIIQGHPFVDGNKRTAFGTVELFLDKNKYNLETPLSGKVFMSLKIANSDITYDEIVEWIFQRLKVSKQ